MSWDVAAGQAVRLALTAQEPIPADEPEDLGLAKVLSKFDLCSGRLKHRLL